MSDHPMSTVRYFLAIAPEGPVLLTNSALTEVADQAAWDALFDSASRARELTPELLRRAGLHPGGQEEPAIRIEDWDLAAETEHVTTGLGSGYRLPGPLSIPVNAIDAAGENLVLGLSEKNLSPSLRLERDANGFAVIHAESSRRAEEVVGWSSSVAVGRIITGHFAREEQLGIPGTQINHVVLRYAETADERLLIEPQGPVLISAQMAQKLKAAAGQEEALGLRVLNAEEAAEALQRERAPSETAMHLAHIWRRTDNGITHQILASGDSARPWLFEMPTETTEPKRFNKKIGQNTWFETHVPATYDSVPDLLPQAVRIVHASQRYPDVVRARPPARVPEKLLAVLPDDTELEAGEPFAANEIPQKLLELVAVLEKGRDLAVLPEDRPVDVGQEETNEVVVSSEVIAHFDRAELEVMVERARQAGVPLVFPEAAQPHGIDPASLELIARDPNSLPELRQDRAIPTGVRVVYRDGPSGQEEDEVDRREMFRQSAGFTAAGVAALMGLDGVVESNTIADAITPEEAIKRYGNYMTPEDRELLQREGSRIGPMAVVRGSFTLHTELPLVEVAYRKVRALKGRQPALGEIFSVVEDSALREKQASEFQLPGLDNIKMNEPVLRRF